MPLISLNPLWPERIATVKLWGHRVGIYAVLNLLDDPAWLALMFC